MTAAAPGERLQELLRRHGLDPLSAEQEASFAAYLALLQRWNTRTNLTAVRDEEGILSRHFVECIACARALPAGVRTALDFGSGAGLPGIPIALCRPEVAVTLAESQGKKAAFLQEAVRTLGLSAEVHASRAEALRPGYDLVVLRAVDRMREAVAEGAGLVAVGGWLGLMTTEADRGALQGAAGGEFAWELGIALPGSEQRVLALGRRAG